MFDTRDPESKDEETAKYGIRRIANNVAVTISPWSLLGWLRSGVTEYLISQGISVCHGMDVTNVTKSNKEYARQICLNSVRNGRARWIKAGRPYDLIIYIGLRYCPPTIHKLNKNWVSNVKFYLAKGK